MDSKDKAEFVRQVWIEEYKAFELRTMGACSNWGSSFMPFWDGGVTSKGVNRTSCWQKIVDFCDQNIIDPRTLIKAVFYGESLAPKPNQAHGQYAMKKYKTYTSAATKQEIRNRIENEFESQKSYTAAKTNTLVQYGSKSEKEALLLTVINESNPLSRLFKYCVLKNQNVPLAEEFKNAAFMKYMENPDIYDEVWEDWIPAELREEAKNRKGGV